MPEGGMTWGLRIPSGPPLPVSAGLGSLISTALSCLGSEGESGPIFNDLTFLVKFVLPCRRIKDSASGTETWGDFPRARGPKNLFWITVAKAAA